MVNIYNIATVFMNRILTFQLLTVRFISKFFFGIIFNSKGYIFFIDNYFEEVVFMVAITQGLDMIWLKKEIPISREID